MKHEELTRDIISAAIAVINELKPGLDEKLYENALVIELRARGHTVNNKSSWFTTAVSTSESWFRI